VHHVEPRQPVVLRLGGFALPLTQPGSAPTAPLVYTSADARATVLQPLTPGLTPDWDRRLDETTPRRHVAAPYHVAPTVRTPRIATPLHRCAALSYAGPDRRRRTVAHPFRLGRRLVAGTSDSRPLENLPLVPPRAPMTTSSPFVRLLRLFAAIPFLVLALHRRCRPRQRRPGERPAHQRPRRARRRLPRLLPHR